MDQPGNLRFCQSWSCFHTQAESGACLRDSSRFLYYFNTWYYSIGTATTSLLAPAVSGFTFYVASIKPPGNCVLHYCINVKIENSYSAGK